jgi:hypothetical protein
VLETSFARLVVELVNLVHRGLVRDSYDGPPAEAARESYAFLGG